MPILSSEKIKENKRPPGVYLMEFSLKSSLASFSLVYGAKFVRDYMSQLCLNDTFWNDLQQHIEIAALKDLNSKSH
jgi:hypothetical protein